ncbi:MAG: hypothetical protein O6950_04415 [Gammaproteobacteria bacterium]|nr:hypothetical protein [Gammaproteobacteria bacterium]
MNQPFLEVGDYPCNGVHPEVGGRVACRQPEHADDDPAPPGLVKKLMLKDAYPHHKVAAAKAARWVTRLAASLLGMTTSRIPDKVPVVGK